MKDRMKTATVKNPEKKKPSHKPKAEKKESLLGCVKGMWLDPNYDFTKPTCPHWN